MAEFYADSSVLVKRHISQAWAQQHEAHSYSSVAERTIRE